MRFCYILLGLFLSISVVRAGAGPPPFTNGSPLQSGIDGTYVAIARSTNVTGVINFAISNGMQSGSTAANQWTFYVDGQILNGTDTVAISQGNISCVLNGGSTSLVASGLDPGLTNGTGATSTSITLPAVFLISGNASAGYFNAKLDQNSSEGYFQGSGRIEGAPARTDQIITIDFTGTTVTSTPVVISGSTLGVFGYQVRGTRQSTQALERSSSSSSSPSP